MFPEHVAGHTVLILYVSIAGDEKRIFEVELAIMCMWTAMWLVLWSATQSVYDAVSGCKVKCLVSNSHSNQPYPFGVVLYMNVQCIVSTYKLSWKRVADEVTTNNGFQSMKNRYCAYHQTTITSFTTLLAAFATIPMYIKIPFAGFDTATKMYTNIYTAVALGTTVSVAFDNCDQTLLKHQKPYHDQKHC